jgi:hypothetical protein
MNPHCLLQFSKEPTIQFTHNLPTVYPQFNHNLPSLSTIYPQITNSLLKFTHNLPRLLIHHLTVFLLRVSLTSPRLYAPVFGDITLHEISDFVNIFHLSTFSFYLSKESNSEHFFKFSLYSNCFYEEKLTAPFRASSCRRTTASCSQAIL